MPVDIGSVSAVLASIASVGKILETTLSLTATGRTLTAEEFDAIEARSLEAAVEKITVQDAREDSRDRNSALAASMSREMIEAILNEMKKISEKAKRGVTDPRLNAAERLKVAQLEQEEYCGHLKIYKQFNGGRLPIDLDEEWEKNNCDSFG